MSHYKPAINVFWTKILPFGTDEVILQAEIEKSQIPYNIAMKIRHILALALAALTSGSAAAAEPTGFYDSCKGKGGNNLLDALHSKIGPHTKVSYDGLYDVYKTSDVHPDGTVWDMYSTKNWGTWSRATKCGNYHGVGDCINREHSMPKNWWGGGKQEQYSDAYHLYPTDGYVNGRRSNYPFGECANGTTFSNGSIKGLGRLGTSTFPGYSGQVFEPDDQYKGDFARTYFYMAACYNDRISSWSSPMLAGNDYPVFKSWAIDLLLKWHREDPVSDKETVRNDAVYAWQKNRNPFIDHPELAEYIWGDKKTSIWNGSDEPADGSFTLPVDGSTIDMGLAAVGIPVSTTVTVRGKDLRSNVTITADQGLSVSPATLTASQANAGANVTLTWTLPQAASYSANLTVASGNAKSTAKVTVRAQEGLPAAPATLVAAESFQANWTYIGDDINGHYSLDVRQAGTSIDGYPRNVDAAAGSYLVDGLDEKTTYTYTLSSATLTSNTVSVTTGERLPYIQFLYDGVLEFTSEPGVPSDPEEILVEIDNIDTDITVSVAAPFEISSDRTNWNRTITLSPEEDRIYMRLNSANDGGYSTVISASAGTYSTESGIIYGTCTDDTPADFIETFEANFAKTYTNGEYQGSAAKWNFYNIGVVGPESQGDRIYAGEKSCRFGKDSSSSLEMLEDKALGAGNVSFYACRWRNNQGNNDPAAVLAVYYSTNHGDTWEHAGDVNIDATEYTLYTVPVRVVGNIRVRIAQVKGSRLHLDDVAITNYKETGINDPSSTYYTWDAYSPAAGTLCVEASEPVTVAVHGIDGITYVATDTIAAGTATYELPAGLYIIVVDGQSRRVLVK